MKNKKGLTLVELLAVIVVLGIIMVIAVPKIMNTMDASRTKALSSSAMKIAASGEDEYLERKTMGDVSFLNGESVPCSEFTEDTKNYETCEVSFTKGKAFVKLQGKGKFDGKYICVGTKEEARVQSEECNLVTMAEEKLIIAARDYARYVDTSFYNRLNNVGDKNYVYKTDLLKEELITEAEVSRLDTFSGVKGELLDNNKVDYSIEYINADPSEYTTEELFTMVQSLNDRVDNLGEGNTGSGEPGGSGGNVDDSVINDLQSQINQNKTSITSISSNLQSNTTTIQNNVTEINSLKNKNSFLEAYPVGSIYISTSNVNPSTIGGTWVSFGTGRTLVGVDSSQTEFATVGKTGGEKTHTLTIAEMPSHEHVSEVNYTAITTGSTSVWAYVTNDSVTKKTNATNFYGFSNPTGGSEAHNNLQPYITVYMWKRTA